MDQTTIEVKKPVKLTSYRYDMEQLLESKYNIRREDLDQDEWRGLISSCAKVNGLVG